MLLDSAAGAAPLEPPTDITDDHAQKHANRSRSLPADSIPHAVPGMADDFELPDTSTLPPPEVLQCSAAAGIQPCWESGCITDCAAEVLSSFALLSVVCMGAHTFGSLLSNLHFPAITTFILFGMLCGPFFLQIMQPAELKDLQFINNVVRTAVLARLPIRGLQCRPAMC